MKTAYRTIGTLAFAILLLTLFLNSTAMSQGFGIKAGLSLSDQSYDYGIASFELDNQSQYGFSAGIFLSHKIGFLSDIRFEVDFVQKGSYANILIDEHVEFVMRKFQDRINYISINVLATPALLSSSVVAPYLIIGPRLDILTGYSSDRSLILLDYLNSTVLGATIGAGIILNSNSSAPLLLEVTYNPDISYAYEFGVLTVRNSTLQLMAGFSF